MMIDVNLPGQHKSEKSDPSGLLIITISIPDGTCKAISGPVHAQTGYHYEDFHENPHLFREILTDSSIKTYDNNIALTRTGNFPEPALYTITHHNGEKRYFRGFHQSHYEGAKEPNELLLTLIDLTREYIQIKELEEEKLKWANIFDAFPDMIVLIGTDHIIKYVNQAICKRFNRSKEEIIGQPSHQFFQGKLYPISVSPHERNLNVSESHEITLYEEYLNIDLLLSVSPWFDDKGTLAGSIYIMRDISRITKLEKDLIEKEEQFRSIFHGPVGIEIYNENGILISINDTALSIFGMKDEKEVLGFDLFSDPNLDPALISRIKKGELVNTEFIVDIADSEWNPEKRSQERLRHLDLTISPLKNHKPEIITGYLVFIQDNTAQMKVQKRIQESEERFRSIFTQSPIGIEFFNPAGDLVAYNNAALRIFGKNENQGLEKINLFRDSLLLNDQIKALAKKEFIDFEFIIDFSLKQNTHKHASSRQGIVVLKNFLSTLHDRNGVISGYLAQIQDITEENQRAKQLKENEEKFRSIFTQSPIGIEFFDKDGYLTMINDAILDIFGLSRAEDILGFHLFSDPTYEPDSIKRIQAGETLTFEHAVNFDKIRELNLFETEKKGRVIMEVSATAIHGDQGEISGYVLQMQDITLINEAQEKLAADASFIQLMMDTVPMPVFSKGIEGKYLGCNQKFEELFGISRKDLIGKVSSEIFPSEFADIVREMDHTVKKGKGVHHIEVRMPLNDGFEHDLIVLKTAFPDGSGNFAGIVGVFIDITLQKKTERALTEANKKLSILSSITRHDILNSITALSGYLHFSLEEIQDEKIAEYLQKASYLSGIIRHQIEFTRIYQDIGETPPSWHPIVPTIRRALDQIELGRISVSIKTCDVEIFAETLIEKVFFNLAENSVRHGGDITSITFHCIPDQGRLLIEYTDDGVGIKDSDRSKLFRKGFGKNTGLGLFLSREILSITGIEISEQGRSGEGVRFVITVPEGSWRRSFTAVSKKEDEI